MRRGFIIYIISLFVLKVSAQDIETTIALADAQFEKENFKNALSLYIRAMYFSEDSISYRIAENVFHCYKDLNQLDKADYYIKLAIENEKNTQLKENLIFERVHYLVLDQKYHYALTQLYNLKSSEYLSDTSRYYFYHGVISYQLKNYEVSEKSFLLALGERNETQNQIQKLFKENSKVQNINPKHAEIFSYIIPGSGQAFYGDFKDGLNSFILTSSLLALYFYTYSNYSFVDAFLSVFPWYQRYYFGGIQNAKENVEKRKNEKHLEVYNKILYEIGESIN